MKTLFRIFLVLFLLLILVVGVSYVLVTRPAFQKKLIESRLPAGSSINYVAITTGSIELADLRIQLPDGTSTKLDSLRADFSPLAAIFDNTLQLRGLALDGLVVKLPELAAGNTTATSSTVSAANRAPSSTSTPMSAPAANTTQPPSGEPASPAAALNALYSMGDLAWLFDLDSIHLNGALIDASRNRYSFDLKSDAIAPDAESTLTLAFKLESKETLQGGLKDFSSDAQLKFFQKASGGFERLSLESHSSGTDAAGGTLISIEQKIELTMDGFEESAELSLDFDADLPRPEVFAPQLLALQGLSLQGKLKASAEGSALTLKTADLDASSNSGRVASVQLKQALTLGAQQKFAGELMDVSLIDLPLAWLNPWLSNGMQLSGAPLSAEIALSGESGGALEVKTLTPLMLGPLSISQNQRPLLQEVTARMNPVIRVEADQTIRYDLGDFELLDRDGVVINGSLSGSKGDSAGASSALSPLAGLQTQAKLNVSLASLLEQPALVGMASVLAGQANVLLNIDGAAEYPAQIQVDLSGLRARDLPGAQQNYRLAAQVKESGSGGYALEAQFEAGAETRPSSRAELSGQVNPELLPIPFKVKLSSSRILQSDLDILMAAFKADASATSAVASSPTPAPTTSRDSAGRAPQDSQTPVVPGPPWANLDGEVAVEIETLTLQSGQSLSGIYAEAKITEALVSVSDFKAALQEGRLSGQGQVSYNPRMANAYVTSSALRFDNVDPSMFSKAPSGSFPLRGRFAGSLNQTGSGATLEQAIDNSVGDLTITGREGILTAFELDSRSQLGLIGAGLLGQSLERPGITALAQAVPYFKDMRFDNFTLKLVRGQDQVVRIPELTFLGDNLRIKGQGSIAASRLSQAFEQPLNLTLGLAAKGQLVEYLQILQLLGPNTSADGFRSWNKDIKLGGTLANPDTSALKDILNSAARQALSQPQSQRPAAQTPEESKDQTKDERRRDDIEMGLDLLNSALGQ